MSIGIVLTLVLTAITGMIAFPGVAHTEEEPLEVIFYAGQTIEVGLISVWNDADNIYVKFEIDDTTDWVMTETHLYVGKTNPEDLTSAPGQFPYCEPHEPNTQYTYVIDLCDIDSYSLELNKKGKPTGKWVADGNTECFDPCDEVPLFIAAHAVVVMQLTDGGCAYSVYGYSQGTEKDGSPIQPVRSDETNTLGSTDNSFFSLGFDDETSGGWIIVEFEEGIGTSLNVVEQSPGTGYGYPLEQAEVYVSADSDNPTVWKYLGMANNQIAGGDQPGQSHQNIFELAECINFVKIVDKTDPTPHGNNADAFDIDSVCGGPCLQEESAWGNGDPIREDKNWAMYFDYTTQCPEEELVCPGIVDYETIEYISDPDNIPGKDITVGSYEDNDYIRVWKEFEGPLPSDLEYDLANGDKATDGLPTGHPYILEEGTPVCIFYVHLDNVGSTSTIEKTGFIEFGADITGAIISGGERGDFAYKDLMFAADDKIGMTGFTYPDDLVGYPPDLNYLRGFEVNDGTNLDDVEINGNRIDFTLYVINAHDSMRIIVPMVPEI